MRILLTFRMRYSILSFGLFFFLGFISKAQDKTIEQLRNDFPEADFASSEAVFEVEFDVDKRSEAFCPITVTESHEHTVYCISESPQFFDINATYGFKSSINNKDLLKVSEIQKISTQTECVSNYSRDIFSSDITTCFTRFFAQSEDEIEVDYSIDYEDALFFPRLIIQQGYPISHATVIISIPEEVELEIHEFNMDHLDFEKSTETKRGEKIITYEITNLPARKFEENMRPGATWHVGHLAFVPKTVITSDGKKNIFNDLSDQYNWYRLLLDDIDETPEYATELTDIMGDIVDEGMTDQQKIEEIFYWVQENIRYIANEDGIMGYKPFSAGEVCHNRYGDCKGMSNLLKEMLVKEGFDARLAWIGTSRISDKYNYRFPSLANDNHMICALNTDSGFVYLDPTEDFIAFGDYANRIQGRKVLIEDGEGYILEEVPMTSELLNGVKKNREISFDGDSLVIQQEMRYMGDFRLQVLREIAALGSDQVDDAVKSFLEGRNKNRTVLSYETSDLDDRENDFVFKHKEVLEHQVVVSDDLLILDLAFISNPPFDELDSARTQPYYHGSKKFIHSLDKVKIPEGYQAKALPDSFEIREEAFEVSIEFKSEGGFVTVEQLAKLKEELIPADKIDLINQLLVDYENAFGGLIVFEKKQ